ncbi:MAG: cysteine--tRNA ligase [Candidatus Omnitrophota bacterium]
MAIFIYNSLTRKKEELLPLKPSQVNMYSCGVTVYDDCHIGHARSLYIFDVIKRYLKYRGFKVNFVRNITDIDDKIINRARELNIKWDDLVKMYIEKYYEDMASLNLDKADNEPRATDNIPDMIFYIQGLLDKGFAYRTQSGVYFSVRKFRGYGRLSGQGIDRMEEGSRIEVDEKKHEQLDFALWKTAKEGEPYWESPWGRGRPGWHIECSVMSTKFLKTDTLDIHAGGRDLIFPHHENEIAQSESFTGKPFAKYWLHHGLLTINGQKMSKSLGNFVTIKDFMLKYRNADILKLFFLSAHYSHPIDFNLERIEESKSALERILIFLDKASKEPQGIAAREAENKDYAQLEEARNNFTAAMDDDFNMPQGLAVLFDLVNIANKNIKDHSFTVSARGLLLELSSVFGLGLKETGDSFAGLSPHIRELIDARSAAKRIGDFKEADRIRKELEGQGVILEDSKEGTTWRRRL